jgi:phosphatidylinositol 4-kinase
VSDSLAVPTSPSTLLSTSPTKSAPAPPPSAAAAVELSDALAASLQKQLRALQALLGAEGGVSIPLDDGGRAELPARVVQLVAETATPIATANRMLFAVDYEQVDAPTMDESYDDVQLKSSEHGFALERRRRSSAAESPTHESDLTPPPPLTSTTPPTTTTAAALPAVAVVIKQSAATATADELSASVAAAVDAAVDEAVDASAADQVLRAAFGEPWRQHVEALRSASKFAGERGWTCRRIIVKYGDALMQEQLAMQLLRHAASIFEEFNLDLPLLTYDIVATTAASGIIECVPNAVSLDALRHAPDWTSLPDFFESAFGPRSSPRYAAAHSTFVRSNAAYSLVSFVLQIKDRHNANVLLTSSGHLCHIDFGFVLTHTVAFEKAPFKLTEEVVNVMALLPTGAVTAATDATGFALYCSLCVQGYLAIRRRADRILLLLEMSRGFGRCYPGLDSDKAVDEVRARLHLDWSERQCADFVLNLIADARDNWRTTVFDSYQQFVNDIQ